MCQLLSSFSFILEILLYMISSLFGINIANLFRNYLLDNINNLAYLFVKKRSLIGKMESKEEI